MTEREMTRYCTAGFNEVRKACSGKPKYRGSNLDFRSKQAKRWFKAIKKPA